MKGINKKQYTKLRPRRIIIRQTSFSSIIPFSLLFLVFGSFIFLKSNVIITSAFFVSNKARGVRNCFLSSENNNNDSQRGLSKIHQNLLRKTSRERQRFVTGKNPVIVTIKECPTLKWLGLGRRRNSNSNSKVETTTTTTTTAVSQLLINGTSVGRSLASYDTFQWLDDDEREERKNRYAMVSLELVGEINIPKPGYINVLPSHAAGSTAAFLRRFGKNPSDRYSWKTSWERLLLSKHGDSNNNNDYSDATIASAITSTYATTTATRDDNVVYKDGITTTATTPTVNSNSNDRVWVTGFSVTGRKGFLNSIDTYSGHMESVESRTEATILWPNEVSHVPSRLLGKETTTSQEDEQPQQGQAVGSVHNNGTTVIEKDHDNHESNDYMEDALLVCDGFLVPGKDRGGLYVVKNPGHPHNEWAVCLTSAATDDSGSSNQNTADINNNNDGWFYHRAVWIDLTGDGRKSILTARAKLPTVLNGGGVTKKKSGEHTASPNSYYGELLWLEMPKPYRIDPATGTALEKNGTVFDPFSSRHLPWKTRVLTKGPDVMFNVADLDVEDDTIEVIASQFFGEKVTLHSIQRGLKPKVVLERVLDTNCGAAFGCILADLDGGSKQNDKKRAVLDSGSTVMTLQQGDAFSHLLVTSHECSLADDSSTTTTTTSTTKGNKADSVYSSSTKKKKKKKISSTTTTTGHGNSTDCSNDDDNKVTDKEEESLSSSSSAVSSRRDGGSLFAYRVPEGKGQWKTSPWIRTTVASGFKVQGQLGNMINPGAPGFVYTFHVKKRDANNITNNIKRPMIAVAGDCAESAYLFRPDDDDSSSSSSSAETEPLLADAREGDEEKDCHAITTIAKRNTTAAITTTNAVLDTSAKYKLMCEIQCGATVGSIGIGYDDFCEEQQEKGFAKLYLPCYEKDRILVFALGSGEDDDGW